MKTSTKIILSVGGIFVFIILIILLVVGAFTIWISNDREFENSRKDAQVKGREFGPKTDNNGCIEEGLSRVRTVTAFELKKSLVNGAFVEECLKASRPVNNFCEGVPSLWDLDERDWREAQCQKAGMDITETDCLEVFDEKRDYCIFNKK